jgi:alanine dehydrogenase
VVTGLISRARLLQYTAIADVLIGAILIPGERAPFLVTEEMVKSMRQGSVIIDVSIDQGGCVETSRPTTLDDPTFVVHDVVHYCVPNMTANVARTGSRALADVVMEPVGRIADLGLDGALEADRGLAAGVYLYRGQPMAVELADALGTDPISPSDLRPGGNAS